MNKIKLALGSRTFWTLVVMFIINTVHANNGIIPTYIMDIVNPLLTVAASYFKLNPSQNYTANPVAPEIMNDRM